MKIVIDIPKEFEEHFKSDRFEDSLARIASDIESFGFQLAGRYEQETITMLREAIKKGTPLPKGHGRLIDAGKFIDILNSAQIEGLNTYKGLGRAKELLTETHTIIEADKESEDKE